MSGILLFSVLLPGFISAHPTSIHISLLWHCFVNCLDYKQSLFFLLRSSSRGKDIANVGVRKPIGEEKQEKKELERLRAGVSAARRTQEEIRDCSQSINCHVQTPVIYMAVCSHYRLLSSRCLLSLQKCWNGGVLNVCPNRKYIGSVCSVFGKYWYIGP